ncbi:MAG TPA: cytochrome c oxidase accessory protein CcoG [Cytophagaceae bacterium]|nr:cytochrome c oxidase accessory protein CcoG [Cytophagaceae bacterium]
MQAAITHTIPDNSFRDKISTVDDKGRRVWLYPKKPKGKMTRYRNYVGYTLLAFLFLAPFIKIAGEPLILLNVLQRHFVFFGVVFWPQDFHLFLFGMLAFVLFVVLFTVVYGRVFCGLACPQTIFMELVFRKIEYAIEGDWKAQQTLDKSSVNASKIMKKALKHFIFFFISFLISNLFLTYLIGVDSWWKIVSDDPAQHIAGLSTMLTFTAVFYFVYARFREQVCTTVCPYGRLQGVMLDKKSIVVAYDYHRGEPRGKIRKHENRQQLKGDCVDCSLCVQVCPTGIDIRNGLQLECINCTACMDACDEVMDKVGLPQGLIRYASEEGIANQQPLRWTKRIIAYSAVLVLIIVFLGVLLITRSDVETSILRTPGILYQEYGKNEYSNLYNVKLVNKTHKDFTVSFKLENMQGKIFPVGKLPMAKAESIAEGALFIVLDKENIKSMKTKAIIGVYENGRLIEKVNTTFIAPAP